MAATRALSFFVDTLPALPRWVKRAGVTAIDAVIFVLSFLLVSFSLRGWMPPFPAKLWMVLVLSLVAGLGAAIFVGLYRAVFRFWGEDIFLRAIIAGIASAVTALAVSGFFFEVWLGAGFFLSLAVVSACGIATTRLGLSIFMRMLLERAARPTVIYGAGPPGRQVLALMRSDRDHKVVCFVDDDPSLWGQTVEGVRVHSPESLARIHAKTKFEAVVLAIPSVDPAIRRSILARLSPLRVHVFSIPSLEQMLSGKQDSTGLVELDVADLLPRDRVEPVTELFKQCVFGRSILVSGAGGSIGSEICRQILAAKPRVLVLYEVSEAALYEIDRELRALHREGSIRIVSMLGDVRDAGRVFAVYKRFEVETIYHAAAYKHVPIVEANVVEGVRNNVFGTLTMAEEAVRAGVRHFVLVSTDKAVNPTNVMGAAKRCAELICQGLNQKQVAQTEGSHAGTLFSMVRFGNVLASSGSVVPLFQDQVRCGGPITVTHPEVTRYFMTIREAAQLVIQASGIASGGDVFILDMGRPVKILDLGRRVIELMGRTIRDENNPGGDIEIEYSGLRPGEKLYEELLIDAEAKPTVHPKVWRAIEPSWDWELLTARLTRLRLACDTGDSDRCRQLLKELVPEYRSTAENFDLLSVRMETSQ